MSRFLQFALRGCGAARSPRSSWQHSSILGRAALPDAARAGPRRAGDAAPLRPRHLAVVRGDGPAGRAAGRRPAATARDGAWKPTEKTSPTDIAAYLWSTLAAEDLQIIEASRGRAAPRSDAGRAGTPGARPWLLLRLVRCPDRAPPDDLGRRRQADAARCSRRWTTAGSRPP